MKAVFLSLYEPKLRFMGIPCLLLGAAMTAGMPPFFFWPVSLLALAGLFWLVMEAANFRQAFMAGFLFGLGHALTGFYWIPQAFVVSFKGDIPSSFAVGIPLLLALAAYTAFYTALTAGLTRLFPFPHSWKPFLFALLWVMGEAIRSLFWSGWAWNLTGYIFANNLSFMQLASWAGIWGLSFLAVLASALFFVGNKKGLASALILSLAFAAGSWRLNMAPEVGSALSTTRVALVQANISQSEKWKKENREEHLRKYINMTADQAQKNAHIFIWPETAITFPLNLHPDAAKQIARALPAGATLISGFPRMEGNTFYNSVGALTSDGKITSIYNKHNLIPFGEFVPLRRFMPSFVDKITEGSTIDYSPGTGPVNLTMAGGYLTTEQGKTTNTRALLNALPTICYEITFPTFVKENVAGKDFILEVTNDSWFDGTTAPYQHYAMARLRAIETGLPLVRAASTGISAVIDPYGREVARLGLNQTGIVNTYLPEKIKTPFFIEFYAPLSLAKKVYSSYYPL